MTNNKIVTFHILLALQFVLVAAGMLVNIKVGLFSMIIILSFTTICLIQLNNDEQTNWKAGQNIMTYMFTIWLCFYLLEILNPNNVLAAWNINLTPYALIPLICAFVVPLVVRTKKDIELLLIIWSVFVLVFTIKGYWQKNYGFSSKDLYFLHVLGGWRTHIIWSGIRYFSCFSDAANYGVHAAMSAVVFAISAFFVESKWLRIYFLCIAVGGLYGMGISGTRAAMGVIMGGMLMITVIAKNWKALLAGIFISISVFVFFSYTNIGSGNQYIHKMRSSFHPSEDASYQVRVENRQRMKELMAKKPLGYGIGLSKAPPLQLFHVLPLLGQKPGGLLHPGLPLLILRPQIVQPPLQPICPGQPSVQLLELPVDLVQPLVHAVPLLFLYSTASEGKAQGNPLDFPVKFA